EFRAGVAKLVARGLEAKLHIALPAVTTDAFRVRLLGNMEFLEEIPELLAAGAEGIGVYRTEFLFLDRLEGPTREAAYVAHRGGALPRLPERAGEAGREAGDHPYRRPGRRQDARVPEGGAGTQSGDGAAGNPLLASAAGDVPGPAPGATPGLGARKPPGD